MRIVTLLLLVTLTACAGKKKPAEESYVDADVPVSGTPFEKGLKALEQERYTEAAQIFDKLLVTNPATEKDLITVFNSGAAYEGLGNCQKAADRYREVVRASGGKFKRVDGQALFRLSLMYECLGQDAKTVTALLDARKRGSELPWETIQAEIPARLAAAYARLGNRKKAMQYFAQANAALKKLVAQETGKKQQELLGRTMFLMGQLNPAQRKAEGDPLSFLQGLSMQQPYLLQAVEMGHPVWAKRASDDLVTAYENIWKFKIADPKAQYDYYARALQTIRELKGIRLPGKSDPKLDMVFARADQAESRLQAELARVAETTKLTPDAEKREGLKRQGRLITPPKPATAKKKKR